MTVTERNHTTNGGGGSATFSVTLSGAPATGSKLVVQVQNLTANTINSIVLDPSGVNASFSKDVGISAATKEEIWSVDCPAGAGTTVQFNLSGNFGSYQVNICEVTGVAVGSPAAGLTNSHSTVSGTSSQPGSITLSGDYVVFTSAGEAAGGSVTHTPPTGFTELSDTVVSEGWAYQIITGGSGSINPTWTVASGSSVAVIAAYAKASSTVIPVILSDEFDEE